MREADALVRLRGHGIDAVPHGWTVSKVKYLAAYTNGYPFKPDQWGTAGKPIIRIQNLTDPSAEPNRFEGNLDEARSIGARFDTPEAQTRIAAFAAASVRRRSDKQESP